MSDLFRERVTNFLKDYVTLNECGVDGEGRAGIEAIKQSLYIILKSSILTAEQISKELLKFDVILPPHCINEWASYAKTYTE